MRQTSYNTAMAEWVKHELVQFVYIAIFNFQSNYNKKGKNYLIEMH